MSGTLTARGVTKSFGARTVLSDVTVTIAPGSRVGVVGPNGVGKTTLLRILAGLEAPDAGVVVRAPTQMSVGWLPQETDARPDETLTSYLARRTGVAEAEAEVDGLSQTMDDVGAYTDALDRYVALGGGDLGRRASEVCSSLGLGARRLTQGMLTLSGGQRARAALAAILLSRFDVLLLDEPTNDLDFDGLERLESFCASAPCGLAVVSHDRAFLERCVQTVVEIDEHTHRAKEFGGGFAAYLHERELARQQAYEAWERNLRERSELTSSVQRIREWSAKGVGRAKRAARTGDEPDKHVKTARIASSEKIASKIRSISKRVERLDDVDKPWEPWQLRMTLAPAKRSGDVVARLSGAVVRRGDFVLGPLDVEVAWGDRVALLGPNGSGKTTLIEAILGRVELDEGTRYLGPGVVAGEMTQDREVYTADRPLLDVFCDRSDMRPAEARTLLAKFGLGADEVTRWCATLSPGERTRAVLADLMASGTNLLVLDEPTNHLDLPAIEELERALDGYEGTVLLVTHDRRLLDNLRVDRTVRL